MIVQLANVTINENARSSKISDFARLTILTRKNDVLLNSVQEFIEIEV